MGGWRPVHAPDLALSGGVLNSIGHLRGNGLRCGHGFVRHRLGVRRFDIRNGPAGESSAIVKLQSAKTAMIQSAAQNSRQQIQKTRNHAIDFVALAKLSHPVGSAARTTALASETIPVQPGRTLTVLAIAALVQRHIAEALRKTPVYPPKVRAAAASALSHFVIYSVIHLQKTTIGQLRHTSYGFV